MIGCCTTARYIYEIGLVMSTNVQVLWKKFRLLTPFHNLFLSPMLQPGEDFGVGVFFFWNSEIHEVLEFFLNLSSSTGHIGEVWEKRPGTESHQQLQWMSNLSKWGGSLYTMGSGLTFVDSLELPWFTPPQSCGGVRGRQFHLYGGEIYEFYTWVIPVPSVR